MFTEKSRRKIREYWKKMMCSQHCKMNRGAEQLRKMITSSHGEGWRRYDHQKK